jgi:hypothetical protein
MTDQHPITPPPELVQEWLKEPEFVSGWKGECTLISLTNHRLRNICNRAAQWGADQELEACCEYLTRCAAWEPEDVMELRDLRRPKPPSLKEQALKVLDDISLASFEQDAASIIRRALEALDD